MNPQRLLIDHLDLVNQIARTTGRRRHFSGAEQEDFAGAVRIRLVENDYAILRKFQNRSSLWTYLAAVIERLALDFRVERWGKWRPSNMAERLGPVAILLERLVWRDGHTLEEAMEIVRTNHAASQSYAELRQLWAQLPEQIKTREVGEDAAAGVASGAEGPLSRLYDAAFRVNIERLEGVLRCAFEQMASQDRVLLALRFDQDLSIVEIAELMGSSVPTLHRRLERSVKKMRATLLQSGFDPSQVAGLIGHPRIALAPLLRAEVESFFGRVRLSNQDG